ncbi:hypothetical protein [Paraburkholderia sediminicola]|uniref:hypothetical protein n=1 Tax=Paraburkholderia sediminicola TaxID=458836 RepID=UPI0038BC1CEB
MPHAKRTPTPEMLLALMKPGVVYATHHLAKQIRTPSAQVKTMLISMVDQGRLSTIRPGTKQNLCFMLPGTEHLRKLLPPKPEIDPATVALPRTYVVLTGEISGYDAEIARRQQLCMTLRRVA